MKLVFLKFKNIIPRGLFGAFICSGAVLFLICFGIFILGNYKYVPSWYHYLFEKNPPSYFIYLLLGIGFVLGNCWQPKNSTLEKVFAVLFVAGALFTVFIWFGLSMARHVRIPYNAEVARVTNGIAAFHLSIPHSHYYYFIIAPPLSGIDERYLGNGQFKYQIVISNGKVKTAETPWETNILYKSGETCLAQVGGNSIAPSLKQYLKPAEDYDFQFLFNPPPPDDSRIIFHWQQTTIEKNQ